VRLADSIVMLQRQLADVRNELSELKSMVKGQKINDDDNTTVDLSAGMHNVDTVQEPDSINESIVCDTIPKQRRSRTMVRSNQK